MPLFRRSNSSSAEGGNGAAAEQAAAAHAPRGAVLAAGTRVLREERRPTPLYTEVRMPPTSLHEAAFLGDLTSLHTFLEDGANPDASGCLSGMTPLHLATQQAQVPTMRALLVAHAFPGSVR